MWSDPNFRKVHSILGLVYVMWTNSIKSLSCTLKYWISTLTFDPCVNGLRHGSCDATESESQSTSVGAAVLRFQPVNLQFGFISVGILAYPIHYGVTTLDEERKHKSQAFWWQCGKKSILFWIKEYLGELTWGIHNLQQQLSSIWPNLRTYKIAFSDLV